MSILNDFKTTDGLFFVVESSDKTLKWFELDSCSGKLSARTFLGGMDLNTVKTANDSIKLLISVMIVQATRDPALVPIFAALTSASVTSEGFVVVGLGSGNKWNGS